MRNPLLIAFSTFFLFILSANFTQSSAQIRGKLLKSDGKPLAYTEIEMVPVDSDKIVIDPRMNVTTNSAGSFTFKLPKGKYHLSINFGDKPNALSPYGAFFYPNVIEREKAEVFVIDENSKPQTITFKLPPPLVKKKISGRVFDAGGQPVQNVFIGLRDVEYNVSMTFGEAITDKLGNFSLDAFSVRKYQLGAILFEVFPTTFYDNIEIVGFAESEVFTFDAETKPFKLVINQKQNYDEIRDKYVGFLERNYFQERVFGVDN